MTEAAQGEKQEEGPKTGFALNELGFVSRLSSFGDWRCCFKI